MSSESSRSGDGLERQLEGVAARGDLQDTMRRVGLTREHLRREVRDDQLPAADLERENLGEPADRRETAAGDDRHAAAQRLGVARGCAS